MTGEGADLLHDRRHRKRSLPERRIFRIMLAACGLWGAGRAQCDEPVAYPDHANLLVVRDAQGQERPVKTAEDWALRRQHVLDNMQLVMGPLPGADRRVALDVQVVSEEKTDKYLRRKISYVSEPDDRVPAWLLIPLMVPEGLRSASGKGPAMLCLHQTTTIGKDEPAGLGGLPNLHYAHELAERGFVCLAPDYPSFGEYPYDFKVKGKDYSSGSMKAIWNNIRGVDLLAAMNEVDSGRIGVIGHSLGGHNALFTATFEPRIKAVVSSCGFTPFADYYGGKLTGWTSDRYMPRIRDVYQNDPTKVPFDFYEIIAGLAPRGFFSNSPIGDSNFDINGVRKAFAEAEKIYAIFDAKPQLTLVTPDVGHDFPPEIRQQAYEWLAERLK